MKYQDLLNFHKDHYNPSNSRILTYGNFPVEENLKITNEYFKNFEKKETVLIKGTNRFERPQRYYIRGPPESIESEHQTKLAISFLTPGQNDSFDLYFLSSLLMDEPRGPFYKTLIESGLAPDFVSSGFDSSPK
jgi:presequence protease